MHTETVTKNIYKFEELSESAKETAREWFRDVSVHDEWWDYIYDDFGRVCEIIGVHLSEDGPFFSGFCSQGDGASFTGSYAYAKGSKKAIRDYAPQDEKLHAIVDGLEESQRANFYQVTATIYRPYGCFQLHEGTMYCEVERADLVGWQDNESVCDEIQEYMRDLAVWLYKTLEAENEYLNSDSYIDECIEINDYEFCESGDKA